MALNTAPLHLPAKMISEIPQEEVEPHKGTSKKFLKAALFYGEGSGKSSPLVKRVERRSERLHKLPSPVKFKASISGPTVVWKVFPLQAQALAFARKMPDVRTFAFELKDRDATGKRGFLVTHPLHLWTVLKMRKPSDRCWYEVIAQDAPCKLYFDLEFDRGLNPGRDCNAMVREMVDVVRREWEAVFGDRCERQDVLWLDSSTEKKFSCHLVFQRTKLFRDNREAGAFVRLVCDKLRNCTGSGSEAACSLFVKNRHQESVLFCDEGVYTRNRNFRLFQCTKWGKNAPLVVSANDEYVRSENCNEEKTFLDSLVTWSSEREQLYSLLQFTESQENATKYAIEWSQRTYRAAQSPYPELDQFIRSLVEPRGSIREAAFFPETDTVVYTIAGYRYCGNIGREHRSNGVMFVADMQAGMFYQKCFDPDCRAVSFRSTPRPIPEQCLPSYWLNMVPDEMLNA